MKKRAMKKYVPEGLYCYDDKKVCKWWRINKNKPEQLNGYCELLKTGDWEMEHVGLLWDQCKECGIKDYIKEDQLVR